MNIVPLGQRKECLGNLLSLEEGRQIWNTWERMMVMLVYDMKKYLTIKVCISIVLPPYSSLTTEGCSPSRAVYGVVFTRCARDGSPYQVYSTGCLIF